MRPSESTAGPGRERSGTTAALQLDPAAPERAALRGDVNFGSVASLRAAGRLWLSSKPAGTLFQLDLQAVDHCDSAALALLLDWLRHAAARRSIMEMVNFPDGLRAMLPLLGLDVLLVPVAGGGLRVEPRLDQANSGTITGLT